MIFSNFYAKHIPELPPQAGRSLDEEFLGGRAEGGGDAEEVGAGGPGMGIEHGLVARGREAERLAALAVVDLYALEAEARGPYSGHRSSRSRFPRPSLSR